MDFGAAELNFRIIPRLEVKSRKLIKGIRMEGLRVAGDPLEKIIEYYQAGADEIIYSDIVASLYNRAFDLEFIRELARHIFIPLCVGGGVKSVKDIYKLLEAGADKVAINTGAVKNPKLIYDAARVFGSQCIVGEIHAKRSFGSIWEVRTESGRQKHNLDALEWAKRLEDLGSGEILLISVDNDGVKNGLDLGLIKRARKFVSVPITTGGGIGCIEDVNTVVKEGWANAVSISNCLHFNTLSLKELKFQLNEKFPNIRVQSSE